MPAAALHLGQTMQDKSSELPLIHDTVSSARNNRHIVFALYILLYLPLFYLEEKYLRTGYLVSYLPIDDLIPFCEWFAIPYYAWEPYLFLTGFYLFATRPAAFKDYMRFIGWSFFASVMIFALLPNGQNLRPTTFDHNNFCVQILKWTYATDTNTNVCPSLHVVGTLGAMFAMWRIQIPHNRFWRAAYMALGVVISISTVFVKQHSVLDVLVGIAVAVLFYFIVYCWRPAYLRAAARARQPEF